MSMMLDLGTVHQDSELGSSAALTQLEKGLRSTKIGEQSEAIVKFPPLFQKYPFPVLINTALLKLAEVFRQGPNFLKLCVLRVCQESERHLDKMTSVDELVRRIITVMNSNDPMARALTLRTLGALAVILHDRKQVHHKVRSSLDSQDSVEMEAAIYAAERFAARSRTFSVDMCPKLLSMIKGYATPLPVKLKMIPIFGHMYHDATTATQVREACLELLPSYPGQEFIIVILRTLTSLSSHTLIHIPDQVSLLLQYLSTDSRSAVQNVVLTDLSLLAAEDTAHLWTRETILNLISYINSLDHGKDALRVRAVDVLIKIVEAGGVYEMDLGPDSPIINLCQTFSYSPQLSVAASSTQLLTQLAVSCCTEGLDNPELDILSEAMQAIESLCLLVSSGAGEEPVRGISYLRRALKCVVTLCSTRPEATGQFVDILGGMLVSSQQDRSTTMLAVCETLTGLAAIRQGVLSLLVPDLCNLVSSIVVEREMDYDGSGMSTSADNAKTPALSPTDKNRPLVLLLTMLLQTLRGHAWTQDVEEAFRSGVEILDHWSRYRVARAASRYGEHRVGQKLYAGLKEQVWNEPQFYWLQALELLSQGEQILAQQDNRFLQEKLLQAASVFERGLVALRAASTAAKPLTFQLEFVRCRVLYLKVLTGLVSAATSLQTSPPPAIAAALATQSRDDLQRCGRVTGQLRKAVADLAACAAVWEALAESSFDADAASLSLVLVLKKLIGDLALWIEMVCLKSSLQGSMYADTEIEFVPDLVENHSPAIQLQGVINTFKEVAALFKTLSEKPDNQPISHHHTACIFKCVRTINASPLPYPRLFFQSLQETRLKLSVTPAARLTGEPVGVNTSQLLAVKVEGVIDTSGVEHKAARKVSQVLVHLQCDLQSTKALVEPTKPDRPNNKQETSTHLEQTGDLVNDFFAVQFLVPFPLSGIYSINLEARLMDTKGHSWRTGVTHTLTVKAFEDRSNSGRAISRS